MQTKIKITFILLLTSAWVSAQNITGSPFSAFGYGIIENLSTGTSQGIGGAAAGLSLTDEINTRNPAAAGFIPRQTFLFNAGLRSKRVEYSTAESSVVKYDNGFTGLNAAFNITNNWSAGFGVMPYSSIGYKIQTQDSLSYEDISYSTRTNYYGEGGLNKVYLTTAFQYKGLSLGMDVSYMFGVLSARTESAVSDTLHSGFLLRTNNLNMKGLHFSYGLQYKYDLGEYSNITVGAVYRQASDLDSRKVLFGHTVLTSPYATLKDTIVQDTVRNLTAELPQGYSAGVSYKSKRWLFSVDYSADMWEGVSIDQRPLSETVNSFKFSGGLEYRPSHVPETYWQALRFRLGGYYMSDYIKAAGNKVEAYALTFGFGIPAQKSRTMLNLNFEIGKKGKLSSNTLSENFYGLNLSINMSDIWFIQRKFD